MSREAARLGVTVPVRLEIDTGLGRTGIRASDAVVVAAALADLPNLEFEGVYTHEGQLAGVSGDRAAIRAQVTAVSASSADDVTLTLGGTDTDIVWGNADDSALKALVLERQMAATPPEDVSSYDVSSPDVVVVG